MGSQTLRAISCPADDQCWTVGDGGTILTGGVDGPPTNNSPPTIAGGAVDGSTLTASPGGWYGAKPIAFAYQWQECDSSGAGCAAIAGATAQTYAVASGDVGHTIRVAVTATNADGSGTTTSAPTHVVALAKPFNWAPPTITGGPTQGHTLSAGDGGWSGSAPITYGYRWRDCDSSGASCTDIPGATAPSYTLTASDLGHTIHVVVRGTNGAGSVDATSAQTDAVWAPLPASGVIPTSESPLYTDGFTGNTQNLAIHSGPRLVTDGGSQYVAYYHPNASVPSGATIVLGKRALPNGSWSFYDTGFELSNRSTSDCPAGQRTCTDVHEVPALALDDQHRINLIWREGTSGEGPMDAQWARSTAPGDITTMSTHDGTSVGLPTDLAYPWLFEVSGSCTSPGTGANRCGLYLGYHTPGYPADGQLWLKRWDDARGAWVSPIKTPSGTEEPVVDGTCPASSTVPCTTYGQYYAVDTAPTDGVIRLVWTWDKSDGKSSWTPGSDGTTDLSYIQSADGGTTWQSASGATVATPITPGSLAAKQADLLPGQYVTCIDPVTADSTGDAHISFMLPAGGVYQPGDPSAPQTTWNYFHGWIDNGVFHHVQITTLTTPVGAPCGYGTMSGADIVASGQTVFGIMRPSSDAPWYLWRASSPYLQTSIYQLGTAYRGSEAPIVDHTGWEQTGTLMMLNDYLAPGSGSPSATATLSSVDGARLLQAP